MKSDNGLSPAVVVAEAARIAIDAGLPVVALESTIISHGLPKPRNLQVALELEDLVRSGSACPATVAVLDGVARIGLTEAELVRVASEEGFRKLGLRDLPAAMASGASGATTVSATAYLAGLAGIRVFATGGLGGVHRDWMASWDESADLEVLSRCSITIVCAGIKSILDVPASLQRLETLSVTVVGYRTEMFPGFYITSSGEALDWSVDTPDAVASIMRKQDELGISSALVVANPVSLSEQLDPSLHDEVLDEALAAAERGGVRGQALTPFLLDFMRKGTSEGSLQANLAAVRANTALAAKIANSWATTSISRARVPQ